MNRYFRDDDFSDNAPAGVITDHGLLLSTLPDIRNANILVWVGDRLVPRSLAAMPVFDSTVQSGDAVWEGRCYIQ